MDIIQIRKPLNLRKDKSGQVLTNVPMTFLLVIVVLFVIGITVFFVHNFFTEFNDVATDIGVFQGYNESNEVLANGQNVINGFDFLFVMIFVFFAIMLVITGFLLTSRPIFFFIMLFVLIIMLVVGGLLGDIFGDFTSDPILANETATFSNTAFIFDNYVLFILMALFMAVIVFFARRNA